MYMGTLPFLHIKLFGCMLYIHFSSFFYSCFSSEKVIWLSFRYIYFFHLCLQLIKTWILTHSIFMYQTFANKHAFIIRLVVFFNQLRHGTACELSLAKPATLVVWLGRRFLGTVCLTRLRMHTLCGVYSIVLNHFSHPGTHN